eukprot:Ihof_evm1s346 gene=Ihof_evmTU1s346
MASAVLVGATLAALSTLSSGASPTQFQCPDNWASKGYDTYPVVWQPTAYWKCGAGGTAELKYCGAKEVYSEKFYKCVPYKYDYKFKCPDNGDYEGFITYPVKGEPQAYWKCYGYEYGYEYGGYGIKEYCPDKYEYSLKSYECVPYGADKFKCPEGKFKGYVTYPVKDDPYAFWQCKSYGYGAKKFCPKDYVYNPDYRKCLPYGYDKFQCPKDWKSKKYSTYPAEWDARAYWK